MCIIPFYILNEYCIWQDPTLETVLTLKDTERARVVQVRNCAAPYARYYHRESFKERILNNCRDLKPIMYRITNLADLEGEDYYSNFALVLEKP